MHCLRDRYLQRPARCHDLHVLPHGTRHPHHRVCRSGRVHLPHHVVPVAGRMFCVRQRRQGPTGKLRRKRCRLQVFLGGRGQLRRGLCWVRAVLTGANIHRGGLRAVHGHQVCRLQPMWSRAQGNSRMSRAGSLRFSKMRPVSDSLEKWAGRGPVVPRVWIGGHAQVRQQAPSGSAI